MVEVGFVQGKPGRPKGTRKTPEAATLRCGFIDHEGRMVIDPVFEKAYPFHDERALVTFEENWHYIDRTGAVVIKNAPKGRTGPNVPRHFSHGLTVVNVDDRLGYMDVDGNVAIEPRFTLAGSYRGNGALVEEPLGKGDDGKRRIRFGLIDRHGLIRRHLPYSFELGFNDMVFSEGLMRFHGGQEHHQLYGFIDEDGEWAVEPAYSNAGDFHEGRALAESRGRWGYIDREGMVVVDFQYDWAGDFSYFLAPVVKDGRAGFIGRDGRVALDFRYDDAAPFSEGLACVSLHGRPVFIDITGDVRIEGAFERALEFSEGLAPVAVRG